MNHKTQHRLLPGRTAMARAVAVLALLLLLLGGSSGYTTVSAVERENLITALKSTVLVLSLDNDFDITGGGSGTVMDADSGLILTNFHVLGDTDTGRLFNEDGLVVIGVNPPDLKGAPILKYVALLVKGDPDLDLAVVEIVALLDDLDADLPANLGLTAIPMGDSEELMIGDEANVFGFPDVGGATVTYTQGVVSGFLDEDRNGIYEWFKTDTEVNPGNSGGLAINDLGQFIGVPTMVVSDAVVDGKISLIRTGNLALDFFQGGTLTTAPAGDLYVDNVTFGEAINRRNEVPNPQVAFESGITDLYASFDFAGFADGADFAAIWYIDGLENVRDVYTWESGESGTDFSLIYNDDGLPDGYYEVELVYDGQSLHRSGVVVGEAGSGAVTPSGDGSFGAITFSLDADNDNTPMDAGSDFANLDEIVATFDYENMTPGTTWSTAWYYEGQNVTGSEQVWDGGVNGRYLVSLSNGGDQLPVGEYGLELYIEGDLAQSGGFTVSDRVTGPREIDVIGNVYDRDNQRLGIEGALVVFLNPGTAIDDWVDADFPDSMIYASAESTRDGYFQLNRKVAPGEAYSVVAIHSDYEPISEDDYLIPEDATDPYELNVPLRRK